MVVRLFPLLIFLCRIVSVPLEFGHAQEQQPATLEQRVVQLELRVDQLERILFSTSQLNVYEAERRLERAKNQLADSRELFFKGLLAHAQLEQDRFEVARLEIELEMAKSRFEQRMLVSDIEIVEAEQKLAFARQQLELSETLVRRGYASPKEVEAARQNLELAKEALELARRKKEAAEKLDALGAPIQPLKERAIQIDGENEAPPPRPRIK